MTMNTNTNNTQNATDRETVAGLFQTRAEADRAVQSLLDAGYSDAEIDVTPYGDIAEQDGINTGSSYYSPASTYSYNDADVRGYLVTVYGSRAADARAILERGGADLQSDYLGDLGQQGAQRLLLREEQLRANKQRVEAGEVTLHKDVVTETKTLEVPVTREEVYIERHAVTPHTPTSGPITAQTEDIVVPVMEERVTVEKTPVVTEEITVGKRQVQETQVVSDTVRREEARLDNTGAARVTGDALSDTDEMLDEDETVTRTGATTGSRF
jgi:uncharacterized protein (TIGR02271 family)